METNHNKTSKQSVQFTMDLRLLCLLLVGIIVVMLVLWRPWSSVAESDSRTVDVVGEAVIKSEPDEFVFYPTYDFKNANKDAGLAAMSTKSAEVTAKLKELGLADNQIKTNSDSYDKYYFAPEGNEGTPTYTLRLEISLNNKDLAQKVQDYLVSTTPSGQISPQPGFSETKKKELESQARDEATKDARAKADQSAKNLGFGVGKVKSVKDGTGFGDVVPLMAEDSARSSASGAPSLSVQPGEQEIRYTVSVTYYLK